MRTSSIEARPQAHRAGRNVPQARPARLRWRARQSFGALALVLGLLTVPASVAAAQVGAGSIVIGDPGQSATQQQSTGESNSQGNDGSITLGNPTQSNDQQAATNQIITQDQTGTFIVLNNALHQTADQNASTQQNNSQHSGGLVLGNSNQDNVQHATTNQSIDQSMNGTFVVLGNTFTVDARITAGVDELNSCADCAAAMRGGPVLAGGDLKDADGSDQSMNGTYVVFGNLTQAASQNSSTVENNQQDMSGSIVLGDTSQKNNQQAVTNQGIDQSLTGTYIVFGTLDQTAGQNASTLQNNKQDQG